MTNQYRASRRQVAAGAAWAIPTLVIAGSAPAAAASPIPCPTSCLSFCGTLKGNASRSGTFVSYLPEANLKNQCTPAGADEWQFCPQTLTITTNTGRTLTANVDTTCRARLAINVTASEDIYTTFAALPAGETVTRLSFTYRLRFYRSNRELATPQPGGCPYSSNPVTVSLGSNVTGDETPHAFSNGGTCPSV